MKNILIILKDFILQLQNIVPILIILYIIYFFKVSNQFIVVFIIFSTADNFICTLSINKPISTHLLLHAVQMPQRPLYSHPQLHPLTGNVLLK